MYKYYFVKSEVVSGATIFDSNILKVLGDKVESSPVVVGKGMLQFPLWSSKSEFVNIEDCEGGKCIFSHEALGKGCKNLKNYTFLVHNYFPAISGTLSIFLKLYYKLGSIRYFKSIFKNASTVIFISWHDFDAAVLDFPNYKHKFKLIHPGCINDFIYPLDTRVSKLINTPGSSDWFLKKNALKKFYNLNISKEVFSDKFDTGSFISVIYDDFNIGFKLKLLELAQSFQRIISFVDITVELNKMGLELDVITVHDKKSFLLAYNTFLEKGDYPLTKKYQIMNKLKNYSWNNFGVLLND